MLADEEFLELVLIPVRSDYQAFNRYRCGPDTAIRADINVLGGRADDRVSVELLERWSGHTTGACAVSLYDGEHFYHYEHIDALANRVIADA